MRILNIRIQEISPCNRKALALIAVAGMVMFLTIDLCKSKGANEEIGVINKFMTSYDQYLKFPLIATQNQSSFVWAK